MLYYNGRTILLIRNPYKAIASYFAHRKFGTHNNSPLEVNLP